MLFLQLKIGDDRYVVEAKDVVEVVPFIKLKKVPKAPPFIAGLINYRGASVPVVDVCGLLTGAGCERKLSTRIAIVNCGEFERGKVCVGLLLERMTEVVKLNEGDFKDSGVTLKKEPCLGSVALDERGMAQKLIIGKILSEEAKEMLFAACSADSANGSAD